MALLGQTASVPKYNLRNLVIGKTKAQQAFTNLLNRVNPEQVEGVLARASNSIGKTIAQKSPSNDKIIGASIRRQRDRKTRYYLAKLLAVNQIRPGQNELKDAVMSGASRYTHPRAFVGVHYRFAHHLYWVEYGKFGIVETPYFRPGLTEAKPAAKRQIMTELKSLVTTQFGVKSRVNRQGQLLGTRKGMFGGKAIGWQEAAKEILRRN
jgi:hypothetical protein